MPKNRLEAFSDGVFAIIITIIVLGMTLPASFTVANIESFMWDIFIFIESGLIIGQFWYSHSQLLDQAKSIPVVGVFLNILFYHWFHYLQEALWKVLIQHHQL